MRFDKLTQAIAAGAVWRLGVAANDLQIVTSSAPLSVTLYKGGAVLGQGSRVLAGDFFRGLDFDLVELASDVAQEVTILLSDGTSGSNRIVGEVSVINGELSRVRAGTAFTAKTVAAPTVSTYPFAQLYNPVGSGKLVVVSKVTLYGVATQGVRLCDVATQLTAPIKYGLPKYLGGAQSLALVLAENRASVALTSDANTLMTVGEISTETLTIPFAEPVAVPPGRGLTLVSYAVGNGLSPSFQWTEEDL